MSDHAEHVKPDIGCPTCNQEAATAGFRGEEAAVAGLVCPNCGHAFTAAEAGEAVPVRVTETVEAVEAGDASKPYGDVKYADPGYQKDGKNRYPLDTAAHVRSAWSYINQAKNAAMYTAAQLAKVKSSIKAAAKKLDVTIATETTAVEAIDGKRSTSDTRDLLNTALTEKLSAEGVPSYHWCYVQDFTDSIVVYQSRGGTFQRGYSIAESGTVGVVTFPDTPVPVVAQTWFVPAAGGEPTMPATPDVDVSMETTDPAVTAANVTAEAAREGKFPDASSTVSMPGVEVIDHVQISDGRLLEAKGTDESGGRVFRVRIIRNGESKNGRIYPQPVLEAAAPLYEGAMAFDHHRSQQEMNSGTIRGMVGHYSDVTATPDGLEADLHLLPSATHASEALDAALAAQGDGQEPMVGLSHDVHATFRRVDLAGQRRMEATSIVKVNSADVVAHPAAGGKATRAVATAEGEQADETATTDDPAESSAGETTDPAGGPPAENTDPEETDVTVSTEGVLAALKTATAEQLAAVGLTRPATETIPPVVEPAPTRETLGKTEFLGKLLIRQKVVDAGLPETVIESLTEALPDRVSEADVDAQVGSLKAALGIAERAQLVPSGPAVVTQEALDKKVTALDAFFAGDHRKGYRSFREAFMDFTGYRPRSFDEDSNRTILKESIGGGGYDSAMRSTESLSSTTWAQALGDSVTRRMVAEYVQPSLQNWRQIVSETPPINDFRTQRIDRVGGYGVLPAVGQGAPYQPLTTPTNEEATYAVTKRGGTEDLTLEAIANDDVRVIANIPRKLGLAAAQTLYRFVWDILPTNAATTYDGVTLFQAAHNNTDNPAVLAETTLDTGRRRMRQQTAYGDASNVLSFVPKTIVTPSALEKLAWELSTSAVAIPSASNASNIPNLHQGLAPIVIDYYSDNDDWYLVADPAMCPTISIGFYQGREDPELFTQSDPNVGSVFDADKLTLKIRHIYSGTVLDHRAFYRGAN